MPVRVLLVDDQPDAVYLLTMLLRMEGFDARGVGTGGEALRLATDWQPDVICLDLNMPGMSGYDLASHLRRVESTSNSRIVAISGLAPDRVLLDRAGIDLHLLKPVNLKALREVLSVPSLSNGTASNGTAAN